MATVILRKERDERYLGKSWEKLKKCCHCRSTIAINYKDIIFHADMHGRWFTWICPNCNTSNWPWFLPRWVKDYAQDHR